MKNQEKREDVKQNNDALKSDHLGIMGQVKLWLIEAFDALEVVEFTANTLIHGGLIGQIVKITDQEVETINKAFNLE
jgi:hypothetical protein